MKIGIVGTGFMGATHAAGWAKTPATIGGFVSLLPAQAQTLAAQYRAQVYPNFETMLADVDTVDICTPTPLHYPQVLQAAAAGKNIICEKPLGRTVAQAQEMIAACQNAGVKLLVAHVLRFFPEYAHAKYLVNTGELGAPAVLRLSRGTFRPQKATDNWFLDRQKSGGMMLDLMIHDFDYARWIAGDVTRVFAKAFGKNDDHGLAILTHANGAISHIEGSWAYPPPMFRTKFEIAGSDGWVSFDSDTTSGAKFHWHTHSTSANDVPSPGILLDESPYTTQIKAFYHALVDNAPTPVTAADGLAALQISLAAIESAQTGRAINLQKLSEVTQ